jgi:recombination protein RecR
MSAKLLPASLKSLVGELAKLPGVGEKTALRYAVSIVRGGASRSGSIRHALEQVAEDVSFCPTCHFWVDHGECPLCTDASRSDARLCVVRDAPDVLALERHRAHPWKYHVLQGLLAPLSGIGPGQIRLASLFKRIQEASTQEVILAFDATVEGDATALFIRDHLKSLDIPLRLTRTAMGLPAGAAVEYLDPSTLENALQHRMSFE